METPIHKSKGGFENLAEAEKWAKENLQGQRRRNKFTKDEISIGRKSVSEMLAPKFTKAVNENVHMSALRSVLDFIETGIPAEIQTDTHDRGFDVMRFQICRDYKSTAMYCKYRPKHQKSAQQQSMYQHLRKDV